MWFKKIDILLMGNLFEDQTSKNGGGWSTCKYFIVDDSCSDTTCKYIVNFLCIDIDDTHDSRFT